MKQGTGRSYIGARKVEPRVEGIDPGAVSQIGVHEVNTQPEPLYERGFTAPALVGETNHPCGSQGKFK